MTRRTRNVYTSEAELRRLAEQEGKNWVEIAEQLGMPATALRTCASVLGIKSAYHLAGTGHSPKAAVYFDAFKKGKPMLQIATEHGVSKQCVHQTLKRAGLPCSAAQLVKWLLANQKQAA